MFGGRSWWCLAYGEIRILLLLVEITKPPQPVITLIWKRCTKSSYLNILSLKRVPTWNDTGKTNLIISYSLLTLSRVLIQIRRQVEWTHQALVSLLFYFCILLFLPFCLNFLALRTCKGTHAPTCTHRQLWTWYLFDYILGYYRVT